MSRCLLAFQRGEHGADVEDELLTFRGKCDACIVDGAEEPGASGCFELADLTGQGDVLDAEVACGVLDAAMSGGARIGYGRARCAAALTQARDPPWSPGSRPPSYRAGPQVPRSHGWRAGLSTWAADDHEAPGMGH
jgi:hypothetical protein